MPFNNILQKLRKKNNLTQEEMSKQTGISRSALAMYEAGKREPNFETLEIIADFFNVDMNTLLDKKAPSKALTDKIKKLPTDKQQEAEKIIDRISAGETIAAHRADNPMDELPEEARKSIEDFKKFIFEKHGIKYD